MVLTRQLKADQLREGIKGGFDEERFAARVGFGNLRRWAGSCQAWQRGLPGCSCAR